MKHWAGGKKPPSMPGWCSVYAPPPLTTHGRRADCYFRPEVDGNRCNHRRVTLAVVVHKGGRVHSRPPSCCGDDAPGLAGSEIFFAGSQVVRGAGAAIEIATLADRSGEAIIVS